MKLNDCIWLNDEGQNFLKKTFGPYAYGELDISQCVLYSRYGMNINPTMTSDLISPFEKECFQIVLFNRGEHSSYLKYRSIDYGNHMGEYIKKYDFSITWEAGYHHSVSENVKDSEAFQFFIDLYNEILTESTRLYHIHCDVNAIHIQP